MAVRERIGDVLGRWSAPLWATLAKQRHARVFHPRGQLFAGALAAFAGDGPHAALARRLGTRAIARFSAALSAHEREHLEVLGIALRLPDAEQDLLFATIRSPLTMLVAPLATNAHDFLANRYWATCPFVDRATGERVQLRLTPLGRYAGGDPRPRADRLVAAVAAGVCAFGLELRRTLALRWHRIAELAITGAIAPAPRADTLRFDPFRAGAGLVPVGAVHAMRRAAYAASQRARP